MNKEELIESVLMPFLDHVKEGDLKWGMFPKWYDEGIRIKVGLGQGNLAYVPFVAFLGGGQAVKCGIYPVVAYFRNYGRLFVGYGVSIQDDARCLWGGLVKGKQSVGGYFDARGIELISKSESVYAKEWYEGVYEVVDGGMDVADLGRAAEDIMRIIERYRTIA